MIGDTLTVIRKDKAVNIAEDDLQVGHVVSLQTADIVQLTRDY